MDNRKKIVTAEVMADIDARAQNQYSIPGLLLMEQAALGLLSAAESYFSFGPEDARRAMLLFMAGPGNNGGDALAAARAAAVRGYRRVAVLLVRPEVSGQTAVNLTIVGKLGIPVARWDSDPDRCIELMREADYIFDGLTGTGLKGAVRGAAREIILRLETFRESGLLKGKITAVDLPSGLSEEAGSSAPVLHADLTVTLGLPKIALYAPHHRVRCGFIIVRNPGFPLQLLDEAPAAAQLLDLKNFRLPPMDAESFKNRRGHLLIYAGSEQTPGAALLCASASQHVRTGLTTLVVEPSLWAMAAAARPSVIVVKRGYIREQSGMNTGTCSAVLAGPGWGTGEDNYSLLVDLLEEETTVPLVLDADALTLLARRLKKNPHLTGRRPLVLTPHPGEFQRLSGISAAQNPEAVIEGIRVWAAEHRCTIVYKSHLIYIAEPDGQYTIIEGLNPALGTAGSGDVLAGVIAGLAAQGYDPAEAAVTGTAIHQLAGRRLRKRAGIFSSDELIPVIARISR